MYKDKKKKTVIHHLRWNEGWKFPLTHVKAGGGEGAYAWHCSRLNFSEAGQNHKLSIESSGLQVRADRGWLIPQCISSTCTVALNESSLAGY